jgi:hypothetical protein
MSREYTGRVRTRKLYRGDKSVGIQLDVEQALDLAIHVLEATKGGVPIDITIYTDKKKDGTYHTTVTYMLK